MIVLLLFCEIKNIGLISLKQFNVEIFKALQFKTQNLLNDETCSPTPERDLRTFWKKKKNELKNKIGRK